MHSQSPGMAQKFQRSPERRLPAFAPGNLRSTSARAADRRLAVMSGSNVLRTTCRRLLFRLQLTPVQIEVLVLELPLKLESSCAKLDEGVANVARHPAQREGGRRKLDQRFYIGIERLKIALPGSRNLATCAANRVSR